MLKLCVVRKSRIVACSATEVQEVDQVVPTSIIASLGRSADDAPAAREANTASNDVAPAENEEDPITIAGITTLLGAFSLAGGGEHAYDTTTVGTLAAWGFSATETETA